jgi:hypothetical protein
MNAHPVATFSASLSPFTAPSGAGRVAAGGAAAASLARASKGCERRNDTTSHRYFVRNEEKENDRVLRDGTVVVDVEFGLR